LVLAHRSQRNRILWAIGGGLFALVVTTIVFGVSRASLIALSHETTVHARIQAILISFLLVLVFGWIFTNNLHGQLSNAWSALKKAFFKRG
jgi:hypothetical protein